MTKENRRDFITCKVEEVNKEVIANLVNTMRVQFTNLRPQLSGSPKESYEQAIKTLREAGAIGEGEEAKARAELIRKVHSMQKLERLLNSQYGMLLSCYRYLFRLYRVRQSLMFTT